MCVAPVDVDQVLQEFAEIRCSNAACPSRRKGKPGKLLASCLVLTRPSLTLLRLVCPDCRTPSMYRIVD